MVDCAVTGTATGNGARWYEVTKHMYALPVQWGVAAYGVNLALVEQARSGGARFPAEGHDRGAGESNGRSASS